jgi:hypothetical protein
MRCFAAFVCAFVTSWIGAAAAEPPAKTSLSRSDVKFSVPDKPHATLRRGDIAAVIVDNREVDDDVLPGHRPGYSGVGSLTHAKRRENLFVPAVSGLNFEHIHDGTNQDRAILFEPRHAPMELRVIDEHTAELYQKPTPHWGLESCTRYELLEDGTIEMTVECTPRRKTFKHDWIGLFWASYIHQPESLDIHFLGVEEAEVADPKARPEARWIRGVTPRHGELATHLAIGERREFEHDKDFAQALSLVFSRSKHRYSQPWYYGVSHGMALVQIFRPEDKIRLTQSPSGGGGGNPAWDFQWFIEDHKIDQRYQMVMRAMYVPFESREQIERISRPHRVALGH